MSEYTNFDTLVRHLDSPSAMEATAVSEVLKTLESFFDECASELKELEEPDVARGYMFAASWCYAARQELDARWGENNG